MKYIFDIRRKSWYGVKIALKDTDVEAFQPSQSGGISHEGEDLSISVFQEEMDEVTPDKSSSTSDKDFHR